MPKNRIVSIEKGIIYPEDILVNIEQEGKPLAVNIGKLSPNPERTYIKTHLLEYFEITFEQLMADIKAALGGEDTNHLLPP